MQSIQLSNFYQFQQEEVVLSVDESTFTMKNFVNSPEEAKKTVYTELNMASAEFDYFSVVQGPKISNFFAVNDTYILMCGLGYHSNKCWLIFFKFVESKIPKYLKSS